MRKRKKEQNVVKRHVKVSKLTIEHNNDHIGTINVEFSRFMSIQPLKLDFQKCPSIAMLGYPKIQKNILWIKKIMF